jgi:hypothetical protein
MATVEDPFSVEGDPDEGFSAPEMLPILLNSRFSRLCSPLPKEGASGVSGYARVNPSF